MNETIFGQVDDYINNLFSAPDEALQHAVSNITSSGIPQISVSAGQGKLLHILARLSGARKILEIGTLGGYSTIWLARALPAGGKLLTLELDPAHAAVAEQNINYAGLGNMVEIRVGNALETLPLLEKENAGPFDLIFIDADKEPYAAYLQWALKLSRPGTVIIADNVIREGKVLEDHPSDPLVEGVSRFNKALAAHKDLTGTIIQTVGEKNHDGIAVAIVN
jgi:caffeoyl-CoA O-methyltransferase